MNVARSWITALLAVCLSTVSVVGQAIPATCTAADVAGTQFCRTCLTGAVCSTVDSAPDAAPVCTGGQVCKVISGIAACVAVSDVPECACTKSSICDPIDPNTLLVCAETGGYPELAFPCEAAQACTNGNCIITTAAPAGPVVDLGYLCTDNNHFSWVAIPPSCSKYGLCQTTGGDPDPIRDCPSGQYYDTAATTCKAAPPDPCADCDGSCPDPDDCSVFHVCVDKQSVATTKCPDALPTYDPSVSRCIENDAAQCAPITTCDFSAYATTAHPGSATDGATTTERPSTCSSTNVGQNYPYPDNCKMYYTCRQTGTTSYGYVPYTCLGTLVYNPTTQKCDTTVNVPGCVPPTY